MLKRRLVLVKIEDKLRISFAAVYQGAKIYFSHCLALDAQDSCYSLIELSIFYQMPVAIPV